MIHRLFALLIPAVLLAGCAAGRTIRVAEGEDATANEPVALSPAPAGETDRGLAPSSDTLATPPPTPTETSAAPAQGYAPYGSSRTLDIRRVGQWTRTGIGEARRLVIRDVNDWDQFWSELGAGDRPDIDFSRDIVVAVATGQRPTGGYEIAIERVTQADGQLTVEVVERTPGPNCMTTGSLTQPVDVIAVSAADARSWSFVERKEIRGCR